MIRSDSEYRQTLRRILDERQDILDHAEKLRAQGFSPEQVENGVAPLLTLHRMFVEDVEDYRRAKSGDLGCYGTLRDLGRALIGGRIAGGLSQRAVSKVLEIDESQVSRDERNEYSGITLERAADIFDALGIDVRLEYRLATKGQLILKDEAEYHPSEESPLSGREIEFVGEAQRTTVSPLHDPKAAA